MMEIAVLETKKFFSVLFFFWAIRGELLRIGKQPTPQYAVLAVDPVVPLFLELAVRELVMKKRSKVGPCRCVSLVYYSLYRTEALQHFKTHETPWTTAG